MVCSYSFRTAEELFTKCISKWASHRYKYLYWTLFLHNNG